MMGMKGLTTMKRHRHTPEQIVRKLREGDRLLNEGKDITEVQDDRLVIATLQPRCRGAAAVGAGGSRHRPLPQRECMSRPQAKG